VTAILLAPDETFRQHLRQRLMQADCGDVRVAEPPVEFANLLLECEDAVGVLGGRWPDLRPFLRTAVSVRAPAILVLQQQVVVESDSPRSVSSAPRDERRPAVAFRPSRSAISDERAREALEIGARAVLHAGISDAALRAAIAASHTGLIVIDSGLVTFRESLSPEARLLPTGRRLTTRERKILSLVASGVSNKGVARTLGVSVNTVKFHLAAAFEKLNAATRAEAVTEAIRRGELSL
jgi:two-component system, NarL family, nitrate/nitrite response regulator NarL